MTPARRLLLCLLPCALSACVVRVPVEHDASEADQAPIVRIANQLSRHTQPRPAARVVPAPPPPVPVAAAPAPVPAAPVSPPAQPAVPPRPAAMAELPLQGLPNWQVTTVAALSDTEALGPIVERPIPEGSGAPHAVYLPRPPPPPPRPVQCKAVRSREAGDEKIAISCGNTGKQPQTVFLQIDVTGMTAVPSAAEAKAGFALPAGSNRRLVTLTTVSRPARAEIFFTHEAR